MDPRIWCRSLVPWAMLSLLGASPGAAALAGQNLASVGGSRDGRRLSAAISMNEAMAADDPNRDPSWEWWHPGENYLLYLNDGTRPSGPIPPFINSGPASVLYNPGDWDVYPEQGWVLVLRDFGTETRNIRVPFFVLYNRYRGILRLFYFSTQSEAFTSAVAKLSILGGDAALFTLADGDPRAFVEEYDPDREQIALGIVASRQWCYFDLDASGYDPHLAEKSDLRFMIEIAGIDKADVILDLDGTAKPMSETTTTAHKEEGPGFTNLVNGVIKAYDKPAQRYKSLEDTRKKYEQMANDAKNQDKWWAPYLKKLGALGAAKWIPALGPVAGLIEFFAGGGSSSADPPAPVTYVLDAKITGEITTKLPIYFITFLIPGSPHSDPATGELTNTLPLYDRPLGVFNLLTRPVVRWCSVQTHTQCARGRDHDFYPYLYHWAYLQRSGAPLAYAVNPDAGVRLAGIEAAFLPDDGPPDGYVEDGADGYHDLDGGFEAAAAWDLNPHPFNTICAGNPGFVLSPRRIGVRVTLQPEGGDPDVVPVTIIKAYTPSFVEDPPHETPFANRAPSIGAPPPLVEGVAGQPLVVDVSASDGDGDWVTLAAPVPEGATFAVTSDFGQAAGRLSWTPTVEQAGSHGVTFTASQVPAGGSSSAATTVRVLSCLPRVTLAPPSPLPPYSGGETVTLRLEESCGDGLSLSWQLRAYGGATYTVAFGCRTGPPVAGDANTCTVRLGSGQNAVGNGLALWPLAPQKSVEVLLTGTDAYGHMDSRRVSLVVSTQGCVGKECRTE
jgi:hypothetical protein